MTKGTRPVSEVIQFIGQSLDAAEANSREHKEDSTRRARRLAKLVAALALLASVCAFLSARFLDFPKSSYAAFTDIQIIPTGAELSYARVAVGGTRDAQSAALVQTFSEMMTSDRVILAALEKIQGESGKEPNRVREVTPRSFAAELKARVTELKASVAESIDRLNYGSMTPGPPDPLQQVRRAITIDNIKGSFVVRVTVEMEDPQLAALLATVLVESYTEIVNQENALFQERILADYTVQLTDLNRELSAVIQSELAMRESLGVVDLEARLLDLDRSIDNLNDLIIPLRIQLGGLRDVQSSNSGLKNLQQQVASLEAAMNEMIDERKLITKLEFELRTNWKQQESLAAAITEVRNTLYSPALDREYGVVSVNVLRSAKVPTLPEPPTPLQIALIAAFGVVILSMSAAVAVVIFENITRPYD